MSPPVLFRQVPVDSAHVQYCHVIGRRKVQYTCTRSAHYVAHMGGEYHVLSVRI